MANEFDARILKLRLPEQDDIKNDSERCSADTEMLKSIGRVVGQQVRISRKGSGGSGFVALYTVKQANPASANDPSPSNVVRTGQLGRERLGTPGEIDATVHA